MCGLPPILTLQVSFSWWRHLRLSFVNLVLRFAVVPSTWKSSMVVPVINRDGDPTSLDSYRPTSLSSCALKKFRAPDLCSHRAPHPATTRPFPSRHPLVQPRGTLRLRRHEHTFAAFRDIKKAFDSCWIEATLLRFFDFCVMGSLWHSLVNFLCGTLSQVRLGSVSSLGQNSFLWLKPLLFMPAFACAGQELVWFWHFLSVLRRYQMVQKGWTQLEVSGGWLQLIRAAHQRPGSHQSGTVEEWSRASTLRRSECSKGSRVRMAALGREDSATKAGLEAALRCVKEQDKAGVSPGRDPVPEVTFEAARVRGKQLSSQWQISHAQNSMLCKQL